jgi:hypothetical protein
MIDDRSYASSDTDETRYPIKLEFHHNRYRETLYDVDGCVLTGMTGLPLNVFKQELNTMLTERKIRFIHYMEKEPTYAYFVITDNQLDRFLMEREHGSLKRGKVYHVYLDDDSLPKPN